MFYRFAKKISISGEPTCPISFNNGTLASVWHKLIKVVPNVPNVPSVSNAGFASLVCIVAIYTIDMPVKAQLVL